jgi:RHS repeat-associated protein
LPSRRSSDQLTRRQSDGACSSSDYDQKYLYDAAGNRTKTVVGGTTTDFAYNADGQLCKVGGTSCSSANVTYGAAGRTKTWNGWNFKYDAQGRLATACKNSGCTSSADKVEFTYDATGRRTKVKTTPAGGSATTATYRYQGAAVVEEKTGSTVTRQYVLDDSGAVVKMIIPSGQPDAGTYLVTWNGHGDALALYRVFTTGTLELANSFAYSTWGSPTTTLHNGYGDLGFRYLYVGRYGVQWDDWFGLGLYYMSARHYEPELGQFLQPDPADAESNSYAYTAGNPVTRIDPSGTFATVGDGGGTTTPSPAPSPSPLPSPAPSPSPKPMRPPSSSASPAATALPSRSPLPSPTPGPLPIAGPASLDQCNFVIATALHWGATFAAMGTGVGIVATGAAPAGLVTSPSAVAAGAFTITMFGIWQSAERAARQCPLRWP